MTRPTVTMREIILLVAIVALSISNVIAWRAVRDLEGQVELGDAEILREQGRGEQIRAELQECDENLQRVDAELQEWERGIRTRSAHESAPTLRLEQPGQVGDRQPLRPSGEPR